MSDLDGPIPLPGEIPRKYRGLIFANTKASAQTGLTLMCQALGFPALSVWRTFVVATPRTAHYAARGYSLPNRIIIFDDLSPTDEMWEAIVPAIQRTSNEALSISRFTTDRK